MNSTHALAPSASSDPPRLAVPRSRVAARCGCALGALLTTALLLGSQFGLASRYRVQAEEQLAAKRVPAPVALSASAAAPSL